MAALFAALAAALAVRGALAQAWLADDAFITFRYARNLAEGHGLVWNLGERVEGYTNFLWAVVLALGERLGVTAPYLSTALTLGTLAALVFVGTLALSGQKWVALAPALLGLSRPFIEFGTSGLESAPAAVCIALSALWLRDERRRPWAAWWVLTAALLRPDHVLFFGPLLLVQLGAGRRAVTHTLAAGAGWATWWCARWAWYGQFFPNTFHAKSGGGAYWSQGFIYWQDLALSTQLWVVLPLGALAGLWLLTRGQRAGGFAAYCAAGATLYALYIARVGGDFMEYRFGLTSFALYALLLDAIAARIARAGRGGALLAPALLLPLGLGPHLLHVGEKHLNLARESSFYPVLDWSTLRNGNEAWATGLALATLPDAGAHAPPLATGVIGMVGYLTRVPIIDRYGLTNPLVAHKPLAVRGRPGHEKVATIDELLAADAQWSLEPGWAGLADFTRFSVRDVPVYALRDTPAVRALGWNPTGDTLAPTSPEAARKLLIDLHALGSTLGTKAVTARWALPPAELLSAHGTDVTVQGPCEDGARLHVCAGQDLVCAGGRFDARVSCADLGDAWLLPANPVAVAPAAHAAFLRAAGAAPAVALPFDTTTELDAPGVARAGEAFVLTEGAVPGQQVVSGQRGKGLVNGYAHGDAATGRLSLQLPVEPGVPVLVSFLVGGGAACTQLYVEVAGQRACGQDDEVLRTAAFVVTPERDVLELTAVDTATGGWGHLLLDDVRVWPLR
jgi:hypothetical protein